MNFLKLVRLLKHVKQQPHLHGIRPALVVEARRTLAVLQNLLEGRLEQAVGHLVAVAGDRIVSTRTLAVDKTVIGRLAELIKKGSRKVDLYAVDSPVRFW